MASALVVTVMHITLFLHHLQTCTGDNGKSCQAKKNSQGELVANCQNMKLNDISKTIESLPKDLIYLDLSGNHFDNIPSMIFIKFVNLKILKLRNQNNLARLESGCFTNLQDLEYLDLSNNWLCMSTKNSSYPLDVFQELRILRTLNLSLNQCPEGLEHEVYPQALDDVADSLETLYITGLSDVNGLFAKMNRLKEVIFTGPGCSFGNISSHTLAPLHGLVLTKLVIQGCDVNVMGPDALEHFPHLTTLSISCSEVSMAEVIEAIAGLPNDTQLDTLILDGLGKGSGHFLGFEPDDTTGSLTPECSNISSLHSLRRMSARGSHISTINLALFKDCFKQLEYVALGYNAPTKILPNRYEDVYRRYSYYHNIAERFLDVSEVNTLDLSHLFSAGGSYFKNKYCPKFMEIEDHFRPPIYPHPNNTHVHSLEYLYADNMLLSSKGPDSVIDSHTKKSKVRAIDWSHNSLESMGQFVGFHELRFLDLSHNRIQTIAHHAFDAESKLEVLYLQDNNLGEYDFHLTFRQLNNLKVLDLSDNTIEVLHPLAFRHLGCLQRLILADNRLGLQQADFSELFLKLHNLEELDLQWNTINFLQRNAFPDLKKLRKLNLYGNVLFHFEVDLGHMSQLQQLNLGNNHLPDLPRNMAANLECMTRATGAGKLALTLHNNAFRCKCDKVPFFKWLVQTKILHEAVLDIVDRESLQCTDPETDNHVGIKDELVKLVATCPNYHEYYTCNNKRKKVNVSAELFTSAAIGAAGTVVIMTVCLVIHHYRFHMRWKYYMLRWKRRQMSKSNYELIQLEGSSFQGLYNGFVVYNNKSFEDVEWLMEIFLPKVEGKPSEEGFGYKMRLLHTNRDFSKQVPMGERIVGGMATAHKIVLVVSPAFVEDPWCRYATEMALMRGRHLVLCCYREKLERGRVFTSLGMLLQYTDYARYPKPGQNRWRPYDIGIKKFWESTKKQLKIPDTTGPHVDGFVVQANLESNGQVYPMSNGQANPMSNGPIDDVPLLDSQLCPLEHDIPCGQVNMSLIEDNGGDCGTEHHFLVNKDDRGKWSTDGEVPDPLIGLNADTPALAQEANQPRRLEGQFITLDDIESIPVVSANLDNSHVGEHDEDYDDMPIIP